MKKIIQKILEYTCYKCNGTGLGHLDELQCSVCKGTGIRKESMHLFVDEKNKIACDSDNIG